MAWLLASLSLLLAVPVAYVLLSDGHLRGFGVFSIFAEPKAQAHFVGPSEGYPLARCLDGSSGLYYFSEGYGSGASKFQIFHEGGGFCGSDSDCLKRSRSSLGSTAKDSSTMDFGSLNNLKLSRSQDENPLMYNWNHVYLRYCDGGYFSGEVADPVKVGDSALYFRGKHITQAVFQDLTKFGFSNATDIVISGCSAGAIRVFAHLDALKDLALSFSPTAKVVGLPDSGFYMDLDIFTPLKRYVVTRQAARSFLNAGCASEHGDHLEKCLIGSVVAASLKTPFFVLQSRFDLDQQSCEMGAACRASKGCIMDYAANLTETLHQVITHPQRGVFLDSCPRHCSFGKRPLDDKSGLSQLQAFAAWYGGGASEYGQGVVYKCDKCCHGRSGDIPNHGLLPFI